MPSTLPHDILFLIIELLTDTDDAEVKLIEGTQEHVAYVKSSASTITSLSLVSKAFHRWVQAALVKHTYVRVNYSGPVSLTPSQHVPVLWNNTPGEIVGHIPQHALQVNAQIEAPSSPDGYHSGRPGADVCVVSRAHFRAWAHVIRSMSIASLPSSETHIVPPNLFAEEWCTRYSQPMFIVAESRAVGAQRWNSSMGPRPQLTTDAVQKFKSALGALAIRKSDLDSYHQVSYGDETLEGPDRVQEALGDRVGEVLRLLSGRFVRYFRMLQEDGTGVVWRLGGKVSQEPPLQNELKSILKQCSIYLSMFACLYPTAPVKWADDYWGLKALLCRVCLNIWNMHLASQLKDTEAFFYQDECAYRVPSCMCIVLEELADLDITPTTKPYDLPLSMEEWLELCYTMTIVHHLRRYAVIFKLDCNVYQRALRKARKHLGKIMDQAMTCVGTEMLQGRVQKTLTTVQAVIDDPTFGGLMGDEWVVESPPYDFSNACAGVLSVLHDNDESIRLFDPERNKMVSIMRPPVTYPLVSIPGKAMNGRSSSWVL